MSKIYSVTIESSLESHIRQFTTENKVVQNSVSYIYLVWVLTVPNFEEPRKKYLHIQLSQQYSFILKKKPGYIGTYTNTPIDQGTIGHILIYIF